MDVIKKIASGANAINMRIAVYKRGTTIATYDSTALTYLVAIRDNVYKPYVTDGVHCRRLANSATYTDALAYIRAFEGSVLHGSKKDYSIHGVELNNLRFLKNQFSGIKLS